MIPAGRFKRLFAYLIDCLIALFLGLALKALIVNPIIFGMFEKESSDIFFRKCIIIYGIFILALYFVWFEQSKYRATPGKMLFNLYVSDINDQKLTFKRACGRWFLSWSIAIPTIFGAITSSSLDNYYNARMYNYSWVDLIDFGLNIIFLTPIVLTQAKTTLYDILSSTRVNILKIRAPYPYLPPIR